MSTVSGVSRLISWCLWHAGLSGTAKTRVLVTGGGGGFRACFFVEDVPGMLKPWLGAIRADSARALFTLAAAVVFVATTAAPSMSLLSSLVLPFPYPSLPCAWLPVLQ